MEGCCGKAGLVNPYRTIDRLIAAHTDIRRHLGLACFSLATRLCPEIRQELQQMYVQLAQSHAAARYQALVAEHRQAVAQMAQSN